MTVKKLRATRFHRLGKRKALDFNEIVQGRLAADPTGKPVPFPVADFQAVSYGTRHPPGRSGLLPGTQIAF